MAWDSSRPVPWQQLFRSWLVYVAVMAAIFVVLFRDRPLVGMFAGLLVSGPLYLGFMYVLTKFGYQRRTWSELRAEREATSSNGSSRRSSASTDGSGHRPKPAPTKRTGGGGGRPGGKKRRR